MIITQDGYTPGDDPAGVPLIGYDNKVTAVTASSEATGFPASNLLNSATHLAWQGSSAAAQRLGITTSGETDYLAFARHNLADIGARIGLASSSNDDATNGYLTILMHFEGTNGTTDYYDSSGNDVGFGNSSTGTISTAQFKFGAASVTFNATGYIYAGGSNFAFGSGDFTIDLWVRITATGSTYTIFDSGGTTATGMSIRKNSSDVLVFQQNNTDRITGATALTTGTWHHVAVSRSGTSTKMFLNGVQQGSTFTDSSVYGSPSGGLARFGQTLAGTNSFNGFMDELRVLTGKAAFTAAFTPATAAYADGLSAIFGNYNLLLHMDGTDASTTITDSSGEDHIFTAFGTAQLDTAQFKFGTAALLTDGTGDYALGDGSDDFAFGTGDFTIDLWVRFNALTGAFLYDSRASAFTGAYPTIYKQVFDNKMRYFTNGSDVITGTTVLTTGTWHHVAVTRSSGSTRLFLNGVQEGSTYADTTDYQNNLLRPVLCADGTSLGSADGLNGWLDELRVIKGTALWTGNFAPPKRAAGTQAVMGRSVGDLDASPMIFRFTPTSQSLSLTITAGSEAPEIAVLYAGSLLVLERGVKADVQHTDINHARRSNVLVGMSESGNFLGRVLLAEWRESQAEFAWFTPDWYRTNFEPFVESAVLQPFFFAWNPDEYPEETAFAWLIEDIRPETDPPTRRMAATISMRAIA